MEVLTRGMGVLLAAWGSVATAAATPQGIPTEMGKKVVTRYVEIVQASYAEALKDATTLKQEIHALVKNPSAATLESAKKAWIAARASYSPTEAFRFYGGPIDDPKTGPEGLINAWPLDEAYIDYVKGNSAAGIINNPKNFPKITKDTLVSLNEKNGEKNISTGYHAIEFLLWGQDLSTSGPGKRTHNDYIPTKNKFAERRAVYLTLLAELLEEHMTAMVKAWDPRTPGNYGDALKAEPLPESLRKIYTGMVNLSIDEMAGERMIVALEKNDQENEQDCFSDNTLRDMVANEVGIQNIYFGRHGITQGPGVHDLVQALDPDLAHKTTMELQAAMQALQDIPGTFDQVIAAKANSPQRNAAKKAIAALETQARGIAASGLKMQLVLNIQ